jgi:hypothetical protein
MAKTDQELIEFVQSPENSERVEEDYKRYSVYNGKLRDVIKEAIAREFKKPETIMQLSKRIVPINVMQKIINKLAAVYNEPAIRTPKSKDQGDQELIDLYSESFKINQKMKFANRYFKNYKHCLLEPYLDFAGVPRMRSLSSHMYTPIGEDPVEPDRMTTLVKHVFVDKHDKRNTRFQIWTDETFKIVDGDGMVVASEMAAMNNPEGVNPYGVIPFTYIAERDDGNLIPISDDDLLSMSVVIPLLLTDLAFASKYQLWSILAIIGAKSENITFNPNSIMDLPPGADIKVIKPELDSEKALKMVSALVAMLLSTKNLSTGDVSIELEGGGNLGAGVAKMLDNAETTEDRQDQQAFFRTGEQEFWNKYAHKILPVWVESGRVDPEHTGAFQEDFELSIRFGDPKPSMGDKDKVDLEAMKVEKGFTTELRALKAVNNDRDNEGVILLKEEIDKEKKERMKQAQAAMQQASSVQAMSEQMAEEDEASESDE